MLILATADAYLAAALLGQQMKLRILCEKLLMISQRCLGIPPCRCCALADGIQWILSEATFRTPETAPARLQLESTLGWDG